MTSRDYFNAVLNAHISDEMDAASTEFIARLDARNEKRKSTETKDKREARERQRIVLKKDLRRFHHPVLLEKADDFRNIGLNGTSLHAAAGILALKASVGFV